MQEESDPLPAGVYVKGLTEDGGTPSWRVWFKCYVSTLQAHLEYEITMSLWEGGMEVGL